MAEIMETGSVTGLSVPPPAVALDAADGVLDGRYFGRPILSGNTFPSGQFQQTFPAVSSSAFALDAADGVIDGRFFGAPIMSGAAPVYKTPFVGGLGYTGFGLTGAVGGIAAGSYTFPAASMTRQYPAFQSTYPVAAPAYPAMTTSYVQQPAMSLVRQYPMMPPPVQYYQAPPRIQYVAAPPRIQYVEAPPQVQYIEAPPVVLSLPAPLPPAPAPLPPPPSVIHIKDDSGPKIASLQAEIRRLERLLATAKETEAALRGEIQELHVKIELWTQKDLQTNALEAELARIREQLLEAQRRIVHLEGQRDEAHKHIAFLESQLKAADATMAQMAARIRQLELENTNLRARLESKAELQSRTSMKETYKVKTFELAAKLAVMDGTDDGMYNGLPIEVENEGLYKDLVAQGRRPRQNVSLTGRPASTTTMTETYKVQSFDMAEKLSKLDGTDDGKYNGLPIEVAGEGLYTDLVRAGRRTASSMVAVTSGSGVSSTTIGAQTYKVGNLELAAKLSKMNAADDGTYKGLPIEVQGMGLYRDLRGQN